MLQNEHLNKQLGDYFNKRRQRETDFHNARLKLESLLIAEPGLVWESGTDDEPFDWGWVGEWVRFFSPEEAFEWIKSGIFDAEEAYQMKEGGQSPSDIVQGDRKKEVARQLSDWLKANQQRTKEEHRQHEESCISCISCGGSWEQAHADQFDEEGFCPICTLERAVKSFLGKELGEEEADQLIDAVDLPCSEWIGKGYSPEEAMVWLKAGVFDPNKALELEREKD
jgi:hypothetical protein